MTRDELVARYGEYGEHPAILRGEHEVEALLGHAGPDYWEFVVAVMAREGLAGSALLNRS